AAGTVGELRFDPFAMLPFCGYNMGDYFAHWLRMGEVRDDAVLPRLFWVNWFRKGEDGSFLWPGFGDNSRVLEWVVGRCDGTAEGFETPIGVLPAPAALDTDGLDLSEDALAELLRVDTDAWRDELPQIEAHYDHLGERLPQVLRDELAALAKRLTA
ncbi:MAG: phosphoenolpyruvate carboxykinase (GTP), partial [Acidimicrobiales bacterium]|nr:phosphoenolpyruvate carboxykinase (GTP) [Acidimicrobiales bacterium]